MGSSQTSVSALPNVTVVPSSEYINRTGGVHISGSILENPNSNNAASESSIGELNSRQHIYLENSKNYVSFSELYFFSLNKLIIKFVDT